jgi:hypothetical protein
LDDKYLILSVPWREFQSGNGASQVLPEDLQGGHLWNADPSRTHIQYDHLWAYRMGNRRGKYGYNLKLWDATVLTRLDAFLAALATHIDDHAHFTQIATTESAIGDPVTSWEQEGGSAQRQHEGQLEVIRSMRRHFVQSLVVPALNYDRKHVARMISMLEKEGLGLGSPNSNLHHGLTTTTPAEAPGVLTYTPDSAARWCWRRKSRAMSFRAPTGRALPATIPVMNICTGEFAMT